MGLILRWKLKRRFLSVCVSVCVCVCVCRWSRFEAEVVYTFQLLRTHTHTYHFGIGRPKPEIEAFIPFHAVDGIDATDADHFYIQKYQVKKKNNKKERNKERNKERKWMMALLCRLQCPHLSAGRVNRLLLRLNPDCTARRVTWSPLTSPGDPTPINGRWGIGRAPNAPPITQHSVQKTKGFNHRSEYGKEQEVTWRRWLEIAMQMSLWTTSIAKYVTLWFFLLFCLSVCLPFFLSFYLSVCLSHHPTRSWSNPHRNSPELITEYGVSCFHHQAAGS